MDGILNFFGVIIIIEGEYELHPTFPFLRNFSIYCAVLIFFKLKRRRGSAQMWRCVLAKGTPKQVGGGALRLQESSRPVTTFARTPGQVGDPQTTPSTAPHSWCVKETFQRGTALAIYVPLVSLGMVNGFLDVHLPHQLTTQCQAKMEIYAILKITFCS